MAKEFAKSFYKSKAWKRCRAMYAASVGGLCERCLTKEFVMFNLFKKKKTQHEEPPQQMECPKCGGIMTLTNGLTYKFHCRGQELEAINVTAMKCANCGKMMLNWDEAHVFKN